MAHWHGVSLLALVYLINETGEFHFRADVFCHTASPVRQLHIATLTAQRSLTSEDDDDNWFQGLSLSIHWHQSSPSCVTIYRFRHLVKFQTSSCSTPTKFVAILCRHRHGSSSWCWIELNWIELGLKLGLNWKPILSLYFTEHGNSKCNSAEYKKRKRKNNTQ